MTRKLLFHSGRIYTQDDRVPYCQAVIIAGGKIEWMGQNSDLYAIPSDEYQIVDLEGKTVLPGFWDSHLHFVFWAWSLAMLDIEKCKSYSEVLELIKKQAKKLKKNDWLVGHGWQSDNWRDPVEPHASDLDKIVPRNPVVMFSRDEHSAWVNSLTLKKLDIDRDTPDPQGGEIVRDRSGDPTGVLLEKAAFEVYSQIPIPRLGQSLKAVSSAQKNAHSLGITSVCSFDGADGFGVLQEYHRKHGLKIRVHHYVRSEHLDSLLDLHIKDRYGDRFLKICGVKFFADGALGSKTALMFAPYSDSRTNRGIAQMEYEQLETEIRRAIRGGLSVAVHAIGDKANYNALKAIASAMGRRKHGYRHRVEHCQLLRKRDIELFARHNVIASVQPCHLVSDLDLVVKYWGRRARYSYPYSSLLKSGAVLAFGSDGPIDRIDPLWNIYCAVTRKRPADGCKLYPIERLNVAEAIRATTIDSAYAVGREDELGSISVGKYADIVILEEDPYQIEPEKIPFVKVIATLAEGEFVYGDENFEIW
ncbi:MAG: amidohydrolase family protein [candidate division Zixibacteria bacterium]|nr:amidohydrolase family protein [candidate division Zixibacteria bacterium]